jgi:hypothetical protein
MRNVLQIAGFHTAVGLRRCDCGDYHPMSAGSASISAARNRLLHRLFREISAGSQRPCAGDAGPYARNNHMIVPNLEAGPVVNGEPEAGNLHIRDREGD